MTSTTPIHMPTAATGPAKGSNRADASSSESGGLMGVITALLQKSGAAATQKAQAGTQEAAEAAQDLAAKISDLLAQNGGKIDAAALSQIMPADMAQAIADKLAALQQFMQAGTTQQADITPTLLGDAPSTSLTSDLAAASATTAQDEELLKSMAEQLNALTPGSEDDVALDAVKEDVATVKDDMMATLLAMQGDDAQEQPSPLALQTADAQASNMSANAMRASTSAANKSPLLANTGSAVDASSGEPATGDARGTSSHIDINAEANARAPKQAPAVNTPAASLAAQMQQVAPQPVQNNAFSGMLGSSLGALNSLLSGDSSFSGSMDQGFGGQHGLAGDASLADGMSADARLLAANGSFTT